MVKINYKCSSCVGRLSYKNNSTSLICSFCNKSYDDFIKMDDINVNDLKAAAGALEKACREDWYAKVQSGAISDDVITSADRSLTRMGFAVETTYGDLKARIGTVNEWIEEMTHNINDLEQRIHDIKSSQETSYYKANRRK